MIASSPGSSPLSSPPLSPTSANPFQESDEVAQELLARMLKLRFVRETSGLWVHLSPVLTNREGIHERVQDALVRWYEQGFPSVFRIILDD